MTPERKSEMRALCDVPYGHRTNLTRQDATALLDALDAAERELVYARRVVRAARDVLNRHPGPCACAICNALAAYDTAIVGALREGT